MKIIICTRDLDYGIGSQVKNEIDKFIKNKQITKIYLISPRRYKQKKIENKVIKNRGKYFITKEPNFAIECNKKIKEILKSEKIDRIYLHFPILAEDFGVDTFTKFHGLHKSIIKNNLGGVKAKIAKIFHIIYSIFDYLTIKYSKKVFFVSQKTLSEAKKIYPKQKNKFFYSPNYVDKKKFKRLTIGQIKKIKEKLKIKNNEKIILFIGRLEPTKGIILLLNTIEKLNNKKIKLYIIGEGPLKNRIMKSEFTKYLGKLENEDINKFYNICDLFVLPSYYENCPMTILEAKSAGCKILARDTGDIKNMVGEKNVFNQDREFEKKLIQRII